MFSLEQAIAHWRQEMRDVGVTDPAVLDELESHLRDAIKIRLHTGLSEREVFTVSIEQLGPTERLKQEFTALRRDVRIWLVYGIVALYSLVGGGPAVFKLGSFSDVTLAQRLSAIAAVAVTALLILGGRVFARAVPVIPNRRIRLAIYGSGAVSVLIWLVIFIIL